MYADPAAGERDEDPERFRGQIWRPQSCHDQHHHTLRGHGPIRVPAVWQRGSGKHHSQPALPNGNVCALSLILMKVYI